MNSIKKMFPILAVVALSIMLCAAAMPSDDSDASSIQNNKGTITFNSIDGFNVHLNGYSSGIVGVWITGGYTFFGDVDSNGNALCTYEDSYTIVNPNQFQIEVTYYDIENESRVDFGTMDMPLSMVTFNSNNGTGVTETVYYSTGDSFDLPTFNWTSDGKGITGWSTTTSGSAVEEPYTVTGNITLYAVYGTPVEPTEHRIILDFDGTMGTVSADKGTALPGDTVTLTIAHKEGFQIGSVTVNGSEITPVDGVYSFTMGDADANVVVTFVETFTITVNDTANGRIEVSPEGPVKAGTEVTIRAEADSGYRLTGLTVNGESIFQSGVTEYTITVESDVTISAEFDKIPPETVNVSVGNVTNGSVVLDPAGEVVVGTDVTITVTAADGYRIDRILINGVEWYSPTSDMGAYEGVYDNVTEDIVVTAEFVRQEVPIVNYEVDFVYDHDQGDISGPSTVREGSTVVYDVSAADGYVISAIYVNGTPFELDGTPATCRMPLTITANTTISVTFEEAQSFTVTIGDTEHGGVTASSSTVYEGRSVTLTIDPDFGYRLNGLTITMGGVTTDVTGKVDNNQYTFIVTGDVTVDATFTFAPVDDDDDDEPVNPSTPVQDGDDDSTTYIVAIAAAAVVAILAALILMQTRRS